MLSISCGFTNAYISVVKKHHTNTLTTTSYQVVITLLALFLFERFWLVLPHS